MTSTATANKTSALVKIGFSMISSNLFEIFFLIVPIFDIRLSNGYYKFKNKNNYRMVLPQPILRLLNNKHYIKLHGVLKQQMNGKEVNCKSK